MIPLGELREKKIEELESVLEDLAVQIRDFAQEILKEKEKNVAKYKQLKKSYAQVKTVITEKSIAENIKENTNA